MNRNLGPRVECLDSPVLAQCNLLKKCRLIAPVNLPAKALYEFFLSCSCSCLRNIAALFAAS